MRLSISLFLICGLIYGSCAVCPEETSQIRRVARTRFYVIHLNNRQKDKKEKLQTDWYHAFARCEEKGMTLAKVDKLTTFAVIAQNLRFIVEENALKDTWYWLSAKFDIKKERYRWHHSQDAAGPYINFTNFLYRQPRPTGVGSHVNYKKKYDIKSNDDQCISYAYPYPGYDRPSELGNYGNVACFDERPCISRQTRHVMCEAPHSCKQPDPGPYVLSEGKEQYFDEGNWIVGKRRYIVNWEQRTQEQALEYCKSLGLEPYSPSRYDVCIVPYLKMWSRNVTMSHFWTGWTFNREKEQYLDTQGRVRWTGTKIRNEFNETRDSQDEFDGRSSKFDKSFCVSMTMSYEFTKQMPCPPKNTHCHWHFMDFVPSNCYNLQGTICQHRDNLKRECIWKKSYINNVTQGLIESATVPFGYEDNKEYVRSTYKQTFGSLYCPPGFNMVRERNIKWHTLPSSAKPFKYDYLETYWVVDPQKFEKNSKSVCSVSKVQNGKRVIEKVKCTDWHFYLCKKRYAPPSQPREEYPNFGVPQWKWNDTPTPRPYTF